MKVREIMTPHPLSCTEASAISTVAHLMWQGHCGVIPVTDERGTVTGILTDRDICTFVAARDCSPRQVLAGAVASRLVFTCGPDDDVSDALETMRAHKVRRLPVIEGDRVLVGMLSLTDIARETCAAAARIPPQAFVETYCAVYEGRERPTADLATPARRG